jgi:non-specific serine/threonine protein kinase
MRFSINDIRELVTGPVYNRGVQYYKNNQVLLTRIEEDSFDAEVSGSEVYFVHVASSNGRLHTSCTCPYWDTCKHVVAALLAARSYYEAQQKEMLERKRTPKWQDVMRSLLTPETSFGKPISVAKKWRIIYTIELEDSHWILTAQKAYLKNSGEIGRITSIANFNPDAANISYAPSDPIIINFLQTLPSNYYLYHNYQRNHRRIFYHYFDFNSKFMTYGANFGRLFDLLQESTVYEIKNGQLGAPITIDSAPAQLEYRFERENSNYILKASIISNNQRYSIDSSFYVMTTNPVWLLYQNRLIKLGNCLDARFLQSHSRNRTPLTIPETEMSQFINSYLHQINSFGNFILPEEYQYHIVDRITGKRIYLKEGETHLQVMQCVVYDQVEVDLSQPETEIYSARSDSKVIIRVRRDPVAEAAVVQRLLESGLRKHSEGGLKIVHSKALRWIFEQIPRLVQEGFEIFGKEKLTNFKFNTALPRVSFSVSSQIDWFDLKVAIDFDGIELSLHELRRALQKKTRYVRLVDGSLAALPEDWFVKFEHLFNFGKLEEKKVRLSKYHLTLIDLMLERAHQVETDERLDTQLQRLRRFETIAPASLPECFQGTLREYQKAGYDWFYFLQDFLFGGCLADDMGLGKTVQALALLLNEKQKQVARPSLIVSPTSVIFNWEHEVEKFTPQLRVLNYTGLDRMKDPSEFDKYDIILTSYGIVVRDIRLLSQYRFHYVIVDESQKMKNPLSLTARSIRLLQSNYRLALTGTPIENNTSELWSLFSFLNPGLLGSANYFKKAFASEIEKQQNEATAEQLRRLIFPFILRRTKDQVASELPARVEQISYCHMSEGQSQLYHHWRNYYRALILKQIDEVGLDRSRLRVLEGLTRLRLIACHPHLVDKDVRDTSGKFDALQEAMEDILAEKHKVLIFSQFVKMLTIIREYLDQRQVAYEYLDGRTRNREQCIGRFQQDENVPVFLISLRAGGTGVNLTAADYVIHYDPWWNPAVEMQATDRVHRIGQDKKVFVYKFITKDTIEEKILQLQAQKRKLVSQLITTDSSFFKAITREDIEILFG